MRMSAADKRRSPPTGSGSCPGSPSWRPLRLLRRLGPVVQGDLDLSSGGHYLPTALPPSCGRHRGHRLTLATPLRTDKGVQAASSCATRAASWPGPPPACGRRPAALDRPTLAELMAAYEQEIAARIRPGVPMAVTEIEDRVLIPAAVGRTDLVATGLTLARSASRRLAAGLARPLGAGDTWLDDLAATAADPAALRRTIADEVAARLESLPTHDLADDPAGASRSFGRGPDAPAPDLPLADDEPHGLLAGGHAGAEQAAHGGGDGGRAGLADAAHGHAQVLGLDDHHHAPGWRVRSISSATWAVSRSWTWGRRA